MWVNPSLPGCLNWLMSALVDSCFVIGLTCVTVETSMMNDVYDSGNVRPYVFELIVCELPNSR